MYVNLPTIKKHLNIDNSFIEDDMYLKMLAQVAETTVERHIDCELSKLQNESGALPAPLIYAMLLHIGNMYMIREDVAIGSVTEVPLGYEYLLSLYKDYSKKFENGGTF